MKAHELATDMRQMICMMLPVFHWRSRAQMARWAHAGAATGRPREM